MDLPNRPKTELAPWLTPLRFAALIVGLLVVAFPKVLLGWEAFYYRDYGVLGYPFVYYHHAAFWRGELPFWNPLSNCGAPFLAQWGTMVLYPFSLIYLLLPLPWSLTWFCFAHLVLGALGVYYLVFYWSNSRLGAALAGTAFVFNGVMFSCLLWPNYTVALGWMPWVIYCSERAWTKGGRQTVIAAVVAALQLLSGVPELVLLTWILVGVLAIRAFISSAHIERAAMARRVTAVVLLAAGLTAVQLLPFFDLLQHSHRDKTFSVSKWAMPGYGWGNFLVPLFHCFETPEGPFFQYGQEFITSYYPGIAMIALLSWALFKTTDWRTRLIVAVSFVCVLLAFGENGFLFPLMKRAFPLVGIARYPIKFVIVTALTLPVIAGLTIAQMEKSATSKNALFLWICAGLAAATGLILFLARMRPYRFDQWEPTLKNALVRLAFLGAFGATLIFLLRTQKEKGRSGFSLVLLLIVFLDARTHTAQQNPSIPTTFFADGLWEEQAKTAPPRHGQSRVFITPEAEKLLLRNMVQKPSDQFLGKRMALWSNLNLLEGIPKVNGSSTLQLREQMLVQKRLYETTNRAGLLDLLGVSYESSRENILEWSNRSNYCAFISSGQEVEITNDQDALEKMISGRFDPRAKVFLAGNSGSSSTIVNARGSSSLASQPGEAATITETQISAHRIVFRAKATNSSVCVIPQSYYHCWKAFIDGKATQLWRANVAFQAIVVPPGDHQIVVVYRDWMFWIGVAISVGTITLCGFLWRKGGVNEPQAADQPERSGRGCQCPSGRTPQQ
jgi:hypothetical protein